MATSRSAAACSLLLCLTATVVSAQSNSEVMATLQFNFSNPGARSLALGGAFIARADDATAAYANPAGLTSVLEPEVSVEGRSWSFSSLYTDRGRASGTPTGQGIDTVDGLRFGETEDDVEGLSFLSLLTPVRRGELALAFFRHESINFAAAIETQGAFVFEPESGEDFRLFPIRSSMELRMVNLGIAAGYRLAPRLRIGAGVSLYEIDLDSSTLRYLGPPDGFGQPSFAAERVLFSEGLQAHEDDVALTVGLVWEVTGSWRLGVVYRQGPEFRLAGEVEAGAALVSAGTAFGGTFREGQLLATDRVELRVPDIYGFGVSYRPIDDLTVTFDVDLVRYSQLTDSIVNLGEVRVVDDRLEVFRFAAADYRIEDGEEYRLGVEYVFSDLRRPLAVRLGAWHDPDHRIEYLGNDAREMARWAPGADELHVAGGVGLVGRRWQLDLAVDFSDRIDTIALSLVLPFWRDAD